MKTFTRFIFILLIFITNGSTQEIIHDKKLMTFQDFKYLGAFRITTKNFTESNLNFSQGPIAYNGDNNSLFIIGHAHHQAIFEFPIVDLGTSKSVEELPINGSTLQSAIRPLKSTKLDNPEKLDRIGGMYYFLGKLLVNAYEYYDAPGDNKTSTFIIEDANNLYFSKINGIYSIKGAAKAAGWISEIPEEYRQVLGARWLFGNSSGQPIISRLSVGPSAYSLSIFDFGLFDPVSSNELLSFSTQNPLHGDLFNKNLNNDLWTHMSRATYGFIIPGTKTYMTIGHSAGHKGGICYKCKPEGKKANCSGYCASKPKDSYAMYWAWNVEDLIKVKTGKKLSYEIKPYAYGQIEIPLSNAKSKTIGGGSYDPKSKRLFLNLVNADTAQGEYAKTPIILVYQSP